MREKSFVNFAGRTANQPEIKVSFFIWEFVFRQNNNIGGKEKYHSLLDYGGIVGDELTEGIDIKCCSSEILATVGPSGWGRSILVKLIISSK